MVYSDSFTVDTITLEHVMDFAFKAMYIPNLAI